MTCTLSPGAQPLTPEPTSTISPAISWPITRGGTMRKWPNFEILTSVPQVEQARTRILTSPAPAEGSGASSSRMSPGAWKRATFMILL